MTAVTWDEVAGGSLSATDSQFQMVSEVPSDLVPFHVRLFGGMLSVNKSSLDLDAATSLMRPSILFSLSSTIQDSYCGIHAKRSFHP